MQPDRRSIPPDPRDWRPQAFGRRKPRDIGDPVVEPAWDGVRVLAHVARGDVRIVDVDGADLAPDHPGIAAELADVVLADALVLDGYLTDQALRSGEGVMLEIPESPGVGEHLTQLFLGRQAADHLGGRTRMEDGEARGTRTPGSEGRRAADRPEADAAEGDAPVAFVAIDLLVIDDEPLLDVPLLERKRLLESALPEGALVRRSPYVREPIAGYIVTWRSIGFGGLVYKAANSRYVPGDSNDDWSVIDMPRR